MKKQLIAFSVLCLLACQNRVYANAPQSLTPDKSQPLLPEVKKESLTFSSDDNNFKISFGGRIQADGMMFWGEDYQPIGNGVGFRRVRLASNVSFGKRITGRIEMDLTDGAFSLKDCFIGYQFNNGLLLRAGNFKESFSMDAMTSSGDLLFMEKANMSSAFNPEFHMGVQASWQRNQFWGSAGVHFRAINGSKEKDYAESNSKDGVDEGISYTARGVWMPQSDDKLMGFHLGVAASYRTPKTSAGTKSPNTSRFSSNSLSRINKIKFLDTGPITSVSHDWLAGVELAGFYKAFRMQGEFVMNNTNRMEGLATERFSGGYIQVGYLLFGGQQRYSTSRAAFSEPSFGRGWGDVEVAARFDRIDLNGNIIKGGMSNNWTVGATYYVTRNLKLQLNYSYVTHDKYANAYGSAAVGVMENGQVAYKPEEVVGKGGNDYSQLGVRVQLNF